MKGLQMVRAYGLYSGREHTALESCRAQLQPHAFQPPPAQPERCPRCGAPLTLIVSRTPVLPGRAKDKPTGPGPPGFGMSN